MATGQFALELIATSPRWLHKELWRNRLADPDRSRLAELADLGTKRDAYEQRQGLQPRAVERGDPAMSHEKIHENASGDPTSQQEGHENRDREDSREDCHECDKQRGEASRARRGLPDLRVVRARDR
jgi:hypothetical protein